LGAWIIYLSLLPAMQASLLFGIPHFDKVAHLERMHMVFPLFVRLRKNH
jgi:hypothetical protein